MKLIFFLTSTLFVSLLKKWLSVPLSPGSFEDISKDYDKFSTLIIFSSILFKINLMFYQMNFKKYNLLILINTKLNYKISFTATISQAKKLIGFKSSLNLVFGT